MTATTTMDSVSAWSAIRQPVGGHPWLPDDAPSRAHLVLCFGEVPRLPPGWDESMESPPGAEMCQAARPVMVRKAPGGAIRTGERQRADRARTRQ
jgi:hypothetical protein